MSVTSRPERVLTIAEIYRVARDSTISIRLVDFPAARQVVDLRKSFPRIDPDDASPLAIAGAHLRRAIWRINSTPAAPTDLGLAETADELKSLTYTVLQTRGESFARLVQRAAESLLEISGNGENPLGSAITQSLDEAQGRSIVVAPTLDSAFHVERLFVAAQRPTILTRADLPGLPVTDHLVIVGSPHWYSYSNAAFTAPRAAVVEVVQYNWLPYPTKTEGLLPVESVGVGRPVSIVGKRSHAPLVDADDLPPSPNWNAIAHQARSRGEGAAQVSARPVLLSNDYAILFSASGGSEVSCALIKEGSVSIERQSVADLLPGAFVLVRTAGSGRDFIRELADQRFGADQYRPLLEEWKAPLRERISTYGQRTVSKDVRRRGATTANVAYWASPESIRPRSHHDFQVLLEYLGLSTRGPALMRAADEVLGAHIEAGHYIRDLLEARLGETDFSSFDSQIRIQLEERDGGELSLFRVLHVSDDAFIVDEDMLGQPFPTDGSTWLA